MPRPCLPALTGALGLLLASSLNPAPARAHAIQSNLEHLHGPEVGAPMARATAKDDRLRLTTGFSTGQPLVAAAVRLVPPDGSDAIELGRTDAHGQLDFRLPDQASATWELQVDGGPGHRDYLELPGITARALPKPAPRGELAYATRQLGLLAVLGCFGLGGLAFGRRRT